MQAQTHIQTHGRNFDYFMLATNATDADDINIAAKVAAMDLNAQSDDGPPEAPEQEQMLDDGL